MTSTPAAYMAAITVGHESLSAVAAEPRRRVLTAGRATSGGSALSARDPDGRAGAAGSSRVPTRGAAYTAFVAAVRVTTVHSGSTSDTIGSRSTPTTASVHTRWRIAADVRRYITVCTMAATPSNTDALMAIQRVAEMAGSRKAAVLAHFLLRARVSAGCSGAGSRRPTAAPTSCRAAPQSPTPVSCRRRSAPVVSARTGGP